MDVRFAQPPNIDQLRKGLSSQGLGKSEIQSISDIANPNANEVVISLEQKGRRRPGAGREARTKF